MSDEPATNEPAATAAAVSGHEAVAPVAAPPAPTTPAPINVSVNTGQPGGVGTLSQLPAGVFLSSPGKKLGAYFLDIILATVTLGIGWLVWAAIVAAKGQTPGRMLLKMRVVSVRDGRPLTWGSMVFLHGMVGGFVTGMAWTFTLGVLAFMPLWDRNNQTVADKVASSLVVDDATGVYL